MDQRVDESRDMAERGSAAHDLPASLTSFVGRGDEIRQVLRLLETGRLVTVTGLPGSGKTRLALEAAARVVDDYRDGVRYANLAVCVEAEPAAQVIAAAVGAASPSVGPTSISGGSDTRSSFETIVDYVAGRELLLILDDAERVADSLASDVAALLRSRCLPPGRRCPASSTATPSGCWSTGRRRRVPGSR